MPPLNWTDSYAECTSARGLALSLRMRLEMQAIARWVAVERWETTMILIDITNRPGGTSPLIRYGARTVSAGIHGAIVTGELTPFRHKLRQLYYRRASQGEASGRTRTHVKSPSDL
jgi:hypothetical protein